MYRTDNPLADFTRWDSDREDALAKMPICCECEEHIQEDYYFEINDEIICPNCMRENHRKWTDDFIG